jgi:hypothetical protein
MCQNIPLLSSSNKCTLSSKFVRKKVYIHTDAAFWLSGPDGHIICTMEFVVEICVCQTLAVVSVVQKMQYRGTVCTILDIRSGFNATVVASVHASDDDFRVPVVQEYKKGLGKCSSTCA